MEAAYIGPPHFWGARVIRRRFIYILIVLSLLALPAFIEAADCVVTTRTASCEDDVLTFPPVIDPDVLLYQFVYGGAPRLSFDPLWAIGCFDGTVRVSATDPAGNESAPTFYLWESNPGALMDASNILCEPEKCVGGSWVFVETPDGIRHRCTGKRVPGTCPPPICGEDVWVP